MRSLDALLDDLVPPGRIRAWAAEPAPPGTREAELIRLVPLARDAILSKAPDARRAVLRALLRALRNERSRGRAGHWSYSLDRHVGLVRALARERRAATVPAGKRGSPPRSSELP